MRQHAAVEKTKDLRVFLAAAKDFSSPSVQLHTDKSVLGSSSKVKGGAGQKRLLDGNNIYIYIYIYIYI